MNVRIKSTVIVTLALTVVVATHLVALTGCTAGSTQPTKTVTETVEVAPQACLDAMDVASEGFDLAAEYVDAVERYYTTPAGSQAEAAVLRDVEQTNRRLGELTESDAPQKCRSKAKGNGV